MPTKISWQKTTDGSSSQDIMAMYCRYCLCCEASRCINEKGVFLKSDEQNGISVCDRSALAKDTQSLALNNVITECFVSLATSIRCKILLDRGK